MDKLLAALAAFAENPDAIGDNLFSFFGVITSMKWDEAVAAGHAIYTLKEDAWKKALEREKEDPLKEALGDPMFCRLRCCLGPVVTRVGQLVAEAPKEQQALLIDSVSGRYGFVYLQTADNWKKALGLPINK